MRDPRTWQPNHPERADWGAWVTEGWQALEGGPATPTPCGEKVVRVRAYTRRRGGRTHQVGAYTQTRQGGAEREAGGPARLNLLDVPEAGAAPELMNLADAPTEVAQAREAPPSGNGPVVAIFIGGASDDRPDGPVRGFHKRFSENARNGEVGQNSQYFTWNQQDEIEAYMRAQPPGTRFRIIGHSWGGDTAAKVAAGMAQSGQRLDLLVTIDPVGSARNGGAAFLTQVRAGTGQWINVNATGGSAFNPGNIARRLGGAWDTGPNGYADRFIASGFPHGSFGDMLNERTERGRNIIDEIVHGR